MSRYRYNYNALPTRGSTAENSAYGETGPVTESWNDWVQSLQDRVPHRTLADELEEEEIQVKKSEEFKSSEYSLQMMTPRGAFAFSPSNQKYEGYLQSIILFILNLNPEFCESDFSKKIREALYAPTAYQQTSSSASDRRFLKEEINRVEAEAFVSALPKAPRYSICLLRVPHTKSDFVIETLLKIASFEVLKANKIVEAERWRFSLPAKNAKDLYVALRTVGIVLTITPSTAVKSQLLSEKEIKEIYSPLKESLRIINPGLKTKKRIKARHARDKT